MRFPLLILTGIAAAAFPARAEVNRVEKMAPDVYFHEGDLGRRGHCNNGWIVFTDFILVIDGNFPSGAREVIPKIRETSDRPIRFAFDTHHHGDHAYGNQVWHEAGAIPVAHAGVVSEMKRLETGHYGGKPGRWEETARNRPDVAGSKLKPPTVTFKDELVFDDGVHRVELRHFGTGHTVGDGWAWLPRERILFTGDACVNGPYNFAGDGNITEWIKALERAKALRPLKVCPGHGPVGGPEVLEDQQQYFIALRDEVQKLVDAGLKPGETAAAAETIRLKLRQQERISRYVGSFLPAQVEKVLAEIGGPAFKKP